MVHVPTESSLAHRAQQIVQIVQLASTHMELVHRHVHSVLLEKSLMLSVNNTAMIAPVVGSRPLRVSQCVLFVPLASIRKETMAERLVSIATLGGTHQ